MFLNIIILRGIKIRRHGGQIELKENQFSKDGSAI